MSKYVDDVIKKVEARNHSEPTFIQAVNEHHAIRITKAKYGDAARNIIAMIQ